MKTLVTASLLLVLSTFLLPFAACADQSEEEFLSTLPPEIVEKTLVHRLEEGEGIPAFSLQTLKGEPISTASLQGKPTVLAFFAIDNETRRQRALDLLTSLNQLQATYADKVQIYGVCSDRSGCEATDVKKAKGKLPIVDDTQRVAYSLFGVFMMPTAMVVDAQGTLLAKLPYSGDARTVLEGWVRVALGEVSAEKLLEESTKAEPELSAVEKQVLHHAQLARVMVKRRMYPQAVDEFRKASELQPDAVGYLVEIGFLQLKLEQWVDAEAVFVRALELDQDSIPAVAGLGLALHSQGKDEVAVLELEDAAMVTKPQPRVLIALAEIYAGRGDKDLALQTYAKAFKQLARDLERCESLVETVD
ncbi:MAG: hypothetical protein C0618_10530 [Desulfuromonas sp.]|nr:MAG: hypothetical protein C0618_10530 [Desulfuromonas sp.]